MSKLYFVKQVDEKGFRHECFYREADSKKEIYDYLNNYQWPQSGEWIVLSPEDVEDEE